MAIFARKSKNDASASKPVEALGRMSSATAHDASRIRAIGGEILDLAHKNRSGVLNARFYQDKLMDWAMKDHNFKVQLFRFVDAFPMLRTPESVHDHLVDYLTQPGVSLPAGMSTGLKAGGVAKGLFTKTTSGQIKNMAGNFIAGTDAKDALPKLKKLWDSGIAFSVDLLGEACVSDAEADMYQGKYMDLVTNLPGEVSGWAEKALLERDHLGVVPRTNVSVKISSLSAKCDAIDLEGAIADLMPRLEPVLRAANERGVLINFDMESFEHKDLTLELFWRCCETYDFEAGIAMQAYLKSGEDDARRMAEWAKRTGRRVTVRLVKGAYWDYETIHAEEQGWPCPVWNEKWQTDACFERMTEIFLDACPRSTDEGGVKLALGSHNARSIAAALEGLERRGLPKEAIELQMLHGMADQLKKAGGDMGLRVREYVPVGEMIPGMAYLVRRLLENTSNESWLKSGFLDNASHDELLKDPTEGRGEPKEDLYLHAADRHTLSPSDSRIGDGKPFYTEPLRDFAVKAERDAFGDSIAKADVPKVENSCTPEDAARMVRLASEAFPAWRDTAPEARAAVLTRAAQLMRQRRDELSGVIIQENGKDWRNADADVTEAIDFCEYYARCSIELFGRKRLGRFIGELDEAWYQPRGVAAVISPWNFPLAICCGMTTAALVTGNTVIVKPAEQTPGIAKIMCDILWEAGAPRDALHFCPAPGETTGAALVRDPLVALLAFTGSKAVGLNIIEAAGVTPEEQSFVKRVVCEMGGKNAVIVDESADLDEAVLGVRQSAFGFQGQKCSACSRVVVVDPEGPDGQATKAFMERFVESTRSLVIGDPMEPGTDVGPVIDQEAYTKITGLIETAKREGSQVALEMPVPDGLAERVGKPYVGPTIFERVDPHSTIANEEVFGPVVAVMVARDFEGALHLANSSPYKLTGGVYTRRPSHIEKAKREFRVGNLYINRPCTGALVGRQPFGGFGMSGIGSKAGGSDYLLQFVEPRACSENTMRRGFAPEL
ncbi:MAG: proline dehydrogenase family protein [Planctomycetota bacterium]